jgi:hypothetical protein
MEKSAQEYDVNTILQAKNILDQWAYRERIRRKLPERVGHVSPETLFSRIKDVGILGYLMKRRVATIVLLSVIIIAAAGATVAVRTFLSEAAYHQRQLQSLHNVVGLDQAFGVEYSITQPNTFNIMVTVDPALVSKIEVSYDDGRTWRELYTATPEQYVYAGTKRELMQDSKTISVPGIVTARIRALFVPDVIAAFPEYELPTKNERIGTFEFTGSTITQLSTGEAKTAESITSMGQIPLDLARWEPLSSLDAGMELDAEPQTGFLVENFQLGDVGEYTNIGHCLPGATALDPTVSLHRLNRIELELQLDASSPVTLEPKLVDDLGRVAGVMRVVTPSEDVQTLYIPARSLKGYWGKNIDLSRVRRVELAVTRKVRTQASSGTIVIRRIELFGDGEKLTEAPLPTLNSFAKISLKPDKWRTAKSKNGGIRLSSEGEILKCEVELPYNRITDKELPWVNIEAATEQKDFKRLAAIELRLRWDGASIITLEPKVVTSGRGDTYGRHIWIQPSAELQNVLIYPQDLKYYWSTVVGPTEETRMDLNDLHTFSLGISRKSMSQADSGNLYIESINFLGPVGSRSD